MIPLNHFKTVLNNLANPQYSKIVFYTLRDILATNSPNDTYVVLCIKLNQNDLTKTNEIIMHRPCCPHAPTSVNLIDGFTASGYWLGYFEKLALSKISIQPC